MNQRILGIFGVGAIGGSIGLRARRNGIRVLGADADDAALEEALSLGAIDARAAAQQLSDVSDTLVIAAHLGPTLREIQRLSRTRSRTPALVMDVASVKVPVVRAAAALRTFVATHPMAGTEHSGVRAASADLFDGKTWAYVPSGNEELDHQALTFISSMGGVSFAVDAFDHDRAVALTSHLPQLVASSYAKLLASGDSVTKRLCGPVARELLRISGMSFDLWSDLLRANATNIAPPLRELVEKLQGAADALVRDEVESLAPLFGESHTQ